MFRIVLAAVTALLLTTNAFAQTTIDDVRHAFEPLMHSYDSQMDRAALMRPLVLESSGFAVEVAVCQSLYPSITRNYELGPIDISFDEGRGRGIGTLCGYNDSYHVNTLSTVVGKSNLGRDYGLIVFEGSKTGIDHGFLSTFLDSTNRIVETSSVSMENGRADWYRINATNFNGDLLGSYAGDRPHYPASGISGPFNGQSFIAADGSTGKGVSRQRMTDEKDPSQTLERISITKIDKRDFEGVAIVPTFADAYFKYAGSFYSAPRNYTTYEATFKNGIEICSRALIMKYDPKVYPYPYSQVTVLPSQSGYDSCRGF